MNKAILVTYASKYGATREIAEKIGEDLQQAGLAVDVLPVTSVRELADYQAVVLGSAIYIGKWQPEAEAFLKANEKPLTDRPVWLFSSGPSGTGNPLDLVAGALVPANLKPITDRIQPRDITIFHGNIDLGQDQFHGKICREKCRQKALWRLPRLEHDPFVDERNRRCIEAVWNSPLSGTGSRTFSHA